ADHGELARLESVGQRATQRRALHLLVHAHRVVARLRPVRDAAAHPDRRADRAVPGPAGPLLAPRLLAATADLGPGLRRVGAATDGGEARHHDLVHQADVDRRLEQFRGQLSGPGPLARLVAQVDARHQAPLFAAGFFTLERTITRPPGGPGIAPFTTRRLRS